MRKIKSFQRLPIQDRLWFLMLYPISGMMRLATVILPFRFLSPILGIPYGNVQLSTLVSERQRIMALKIGKTICLMARYTPWQSKCLVQALAAKILFYVYQIPCVVYFGTKLNGDGRIMAHAWVKVGPDIVIGHQGSQQFQVTGTFISKCALPQINSGWF